MSSTPDLTTARGKDRPPQHGKVDSFLPSKSGPLGGVTALIIYVLCGLAAIYLDAPPHSASNPATGEFSINRAMEHERVISRMPHPVGSAEHHRVRDYLLQTLTQLGLSTEVQKAAAVDKRFGQGGTVENIIARLKGSENGKAVLLAAHYDSVFTGPGASDDGAAIAALLESARVLKSSPQLKRDVIFLFTDGEEAGLLGARAFVQESPWAPHVGTVLNFEARGTHGPVIMFETSNQNGWLIGKFGEAALHPVANSLAYEIYKRLPNDTDFTVFKEAGYSGLNFAFIDGLAGYHTDLDNSQQLDPASLQHHGLYAVDLAKAFADDAADDPKIVNAVYFEVPGLRLVRYSRLAAFSMAVLAAVLLVMVLYLAFVKKGMSGREFFWSLAALVGGLLAAVLVAAAAAWATGILAQQSDRIQAGLIHHAGLWVAAFAAFGLAGASTLYVLIRNRIEIPSAALAALVVWFVAMIGVTVFLTGASYVLLWPLLFSLVGWLTMLSSSSNSMRSFSSILLVVVTLPAVFMVVSLAHKIFMAFSGGSGLPVTVFLALLLMLVIWQIGPGRMPRPWLLPGVLLAAGVLFCASAFAISRFDKSHPRFDTLFYAADLDAGQQVWASYDERPDQWTSQFFSGPVRKGEMPDFFPGSARRFLQAPAPNMTFAPPVLGVLEDGTSDGQRRLKMRIQSGRGAPRFSVLVESKAPPSNVLLNGKAVSLFSLQPGTWQLQYTGAGNDGIELAFSIQPSTAVRIKVEDISSDLPQQISSAFRARPEEIMAAPYRFSNAIIVMKSFSL